MSDRTRKTKRNASPATGKKINITDNTATASVGNQAQCKAALIAISSPVNSRRFRGDTVTLGYINQRIHTIESIKQELAKCSSSNVVQNGDEFRVTTRNVADIGGQFR